MAETILQKRKITAGGIQLADLANNEAAFDENLGLYVRKNNAGTAIEIYGKVGVLSQTEIQAILDANYLTATEVNNLIGAAGGGDLVAANNLSDLDNVTTARTNLDVRSTAQVTTEITNAVNTVTLNGLGGLTQAEVDTRVTAGVASQLSAAPAAYDTLQEIAAELAADDTQTASILTQLGGKIDIDGTIDGGVIA